jgi:hypothetical protein
LRREGGDRLEKDFELRVNLNLLTSLPQRAPAGYGRGCPAGTRTPRPLTRSSGFVYQTLRPVFGREKSACVGFR